MDDLSASKGNVVDNVIAVVLCSLFAIVIVVAIVFFTRDSYDSTSLYIQDLYVPSLATTLNKTTTLNTSVYINLKFAREAAFSSPNYTDFLMTLFYGEKRGLLVANHVVEGFSLGRRKEFYVKAAMEAPRLPWEAVFRAVSSGSKVVLMVQLLVIRSERQPEVFAAHVAVDASGHKVSKKPIEFELIGHLFY